jgi:hypothetical protein
MPGRATARRQPGMLCNNGIAGLARLADFREGHFMQPLIRQLAGRGAAAFLWMAAAFGAAAPAAAAAPSASHPLLGIWVLAIPQLGCSETYHFRGDGTTLVKSAAEIGESEFTVSEKPSAKGYYKMEDRVVKDNGKADCAGDVTKVGSRTVNYLRFHPAGTQFVMCREESLEACIGPFERIPAEGI